MARGLVAATVCTLLSVCGHVAAGGALPDLGLTAVLALLLAGFLVTLADRRRGPLAITLLVGGSQLALHGLLQVLGGPHEHAAAPLGAAPLGPAAINPWLMTAAHTVAALLAAAVLTGAENTVFAVAAALARSLPRPPAALPCPTPATVPGTVVVVPCTGRLRGVLGHRLHSRRGPPWPPHSLLHP